MPYFKGLFWFLSIIKLIIAESKIQMINKFKLKLKVKSEILALIFLLIISVTLTSYYNFTKNRVNNSYKEVIENIYFKKTLNHFFENLEPRFKRISHKIKVGETFNGILEQYNINENEISIIKNKLSKKINLNKLNLNQKIHLTIDQNNNSVKDFTLQISNKERVILTQDLENKSFNQEIVFTKLKKI